MRDKKQKKKVQERPALPPREHLEAGAFGSFEPPLEVIGLNAVLYVLKKFRYAERCGIIEFAANWNEDQEQIRRKVSGETPETR